MIALLRRLTAWFAPVNLHDVCRDARVVRAVQCGDLEAARRLTDPEFVEQLRALHRLWGAA